MFDVSDRTLAVVAHRVVDHQLDRDLDRRRVRHAALHALVHVVFWTLKHVANEHHFAVAVEVTDRKDTLENALKANVLTFFGWDVGLEKFFVGTFLNVDQIRNIDDPLNFSEAVTDAEVILNSSSH